MKDGALVDRYTITHKDGKPVDPEKLYFVLDLSDPDVRERAAMEAFIAACERTGYPELASDLRAVLGIRAGAPLTGQGESSLHLLRKALKDVCDAVDDAMCTNADAVNAAVAKGHAALAAKEPPMSKQWIKVGDTFLNLTQVTHVEEIEAKEYVPHSIRCYLNQVIDGIPNWVEFTGDDMSTFWIHFYAAIGFDAD